MESSKKIGIIGTGDYGRALANRLLRCGYDVIMGSRDPDHSRLTQIDQRLTFAEVINTKELLEDSNIEIVFLAIHSWNFESCLSSFRNQIQDKIFIDISNRERPSKTESNAEKLVEAFPGLRVVKAFNTLSAYALESDTFGGTKQVLIASDDTTAKEKVSNLAREMGFTPVDYGVLRASREIEAYPLTLMVGWGWPTLFCLGIFIGWNIVVCIKYIYYYSRSTRRFKWDQVPLAYLNKPVCLTAITLLALSYLPGCLAAFLQIINGTKYKRFPNWFDRWLKARKMIGLYALFFSVWHVAISGIYMSPGYLGSWFESTKVHLPENTSDYVLDFSVRMNLRGEGTISVGILALLLMSILGLSSLPSVGAILNWREWRFVQSHLGYVTLFLVTAHVVIFALPGWMRSPVKMLYRSTFMACVIPFIVLFMKLILITPCVGGYLDKIRGGWERRKSYRKSTDHFLMKNTNLDISSSIET
ncbi:STEAP4 [Acanthosepion pharaonis]|uniref:STEAP4 n=1 Tax=Acanthosepion pharaonis TaxID=158019 RepID=A0A812CLM2_ACAPH|nr:STEAP4 [Sepia pharaonis]